MGAKNHDFRLLGWNERVALPELNVARIRCKVDTGARTSALHAFFVEEFEQDGGQRVRFGLHPDQDSVETEIICESRIFDRRNVTDSGGHTESRIVILTPVVVGKYMWPIEITLTNRDTMQFRMLLGRAAISDSYYVDSSAARLMGEPSTTPIALPAAARRRDDEEE